MPYNSLQISGLFNDISRAPKSFRLVLRRVAGMRRDVLILAIGGRTIAAGVFGAAAGVFGYLAGGER